MLLLKQTGVYLSIVTRKVRFFQHIFGSRPFKVAVLDQVSQKTECHVIFSDNIARVQENKCCTVYMLTCPGLFRVDVW